MCWTLCVKKNLTKSPLLLLEEDSFKVWVIFNFLSEDKYPLIIVPEEVRCGSGKFLHGHLCINSSLEVFVLIQCRVRRRSWTSLFGMEAKQLDSKKIQNLVLWSHVIPLEICRQGGTLPL